MYLSLIVALLISFLTTPIVIKFARRLGLVDDPRKRPHPAHTHQGIVPRAGGLAILLGLVLSLVIFVPINKALTGIVIASIATIAIGLLDDKKHISPYFRFIANIAIAAIIVASGIGVPFITNPFDGIIHLDTWRISFNLLGHHSILVWSNLFALIWLTWMMNIVGWSSGVDGQMPGFVVITAIVLGILSSRYQAHDISQLQVRSLAFITAGAFLGFLPWNFYPQKIMPGYGGKSLAGLLLGTLAIFSGGKVGATLLVLSIPMIDAFYTIIRRLLTQRSPFRADRQHFHHLLLNLGWGKRRIALFYWLVSFILGMATLITTSQQKLFVFVMLFVLINAVLTWLTLARRKIIR